MAKSELLPSIGSRDDDARDRHGIISCDDDVPGHSASIWVLAKLAGGATHVLPTAATPHHANPERVACSVVWRIKAELEVC